MLQYCTLHFAAKLSFILTPPYFTEIAEYQVHRRDSNLNDLDEYHCHRLDNSLHDLIIVIPFA